MEEDVFNCNVLRFETLPSTNLYAIENWEQLSFAEGTVILARCQTAGIGQKGNCWISEIGKNLTFSILLKPTFLPVSSQFDLHKVLSLAVCQTIQDTLPTSDVKIKWPNDIYITNKKVCGILVNNNISGNCYRVAVAGIGINVNQTFFDKSLKNPTSLKLESGINFELDELLSELLENLKYWYKQLKINNIDIINDAYFSKMLNWKTQNKYRYHQNTIEATIIGVNKFGHLLLQTTDNQQITCDIKEIEYIF